MVVQMDEVARARGGFRVGLFGAAVLTAGALFFATSRDAWATVSTPTSPTVSTVPDTMATRMQVCAACHGPQGRGLPGAYLPRIAGKPAAYLYQQLLHFRDGRRRNAAMVSLVDNLSESYMAEIALYFSVLDLPYPPPSSTHGISPEQLTRGKVLALQGDPSLKLPACAQCHGAALTGTLPATPGLLGLPRDYVLGQLGAWRDGARRAVSPDCMGAVARRLSPEDLTAVTAWLAGQPVPRWGKAVPQAVPEATGGICHE
jgi:cytochrome c553